jgi:hypothetical protein
MYPVRAWGPGETCPFLGIAAYFNSDIGQGQITATDWSGTSRNFYAAAKGASPSLGGTTVWGILYA